MEKIAITIRISKDLAQRAKSIVYNTPGLTLSHFIEQAIQNYQHNHKIYPDQIIKLKTGKR